MLIEGREDRIRREGDLYYGRIFWGFKLRRSLETNMQKPKNWGNLAVFGKPRGVGNLGYPAWYPAFSRFAPTFRRLVTIVLWVHF